MNQCLWGIFAKKCIVKIVLPYTMHQFPSSENSMDDSILEPDVIIILYGFKANLNIFFQIRGSICTFSSPSHFIVAVILTLFSPSNR